MDCELDADAVLRIIQQIDPHLNVDGSSRLEGGNTEVCKMDLRDANYRSVTLRIYPDKPAWGLTKEALVAGMKTIRCPPVFQ